MLFFVDKVLHYISCNNAIKIQQLINFSFDNNGFYSSFKFNYSIIGISFSFNSCVVLCVRRLVDGEHDQSS